MKQLHNFLDKLRKEGFSCTCNYQQTVSFGYIENWLIQKENVSFAPLFIVYNDDNGFDYYMPGKQNDIDLIVSEFMNF